MSTLDKLKELQAAATPGPWEVTDGAEKWWYSDTILGEGGAGGALASCTGDNARLIVTAINALPDLIEVVAAAWKALFVESKQMQDWTEEDIALYAALSQVMLDEEEGVGDERGGG
jgi:hypothetical protein